MTSRLLVLLLNLVIAAVSAGEEKPAADPHYTPSGFFDIHLCNWPEKPPFYMVLYRTACFEEIESVIIKDASGEVIGELDPAVYRPMKHQPDERVLIRQIPLTEDRTDGWFEAEVILKNGKRQIAKDLVIHRLIPHVSGNHPADGAEDIPMPQVLHWDEPDGAYWYKVYIRDMWNDEKLIYTSKILPFPEHELPKDTLKPGGYYSWKVHARDVNNDFELGEFNAGSQSWWLEFSVEDEQPSGD